MITRLIWRSLAVVTALATIGVGMTVATTGIAWHTTTDRLATEVAGIESISLDIELLAVEIVPVDGDTIEITSTINTGVQAPQPELVRDDGELHVRFRCATGWVGTAFCTGVVRMTMPRGVDLTVITDLGDVTATGLDSPNATVKTDLGDVSLGWATPPSQVGVDTGAGRIRLALPEVPEGYDVVTTTDSGNIQNSVDLSSDSARSVTVHSSTGDITLT